MNTVTVMEEHKGELATATDDDRPYAATIGAALSRATKALAAAGVPEPRLDAELLLAYVLAWDRSREDIEFRLRLRDHRLEAVREQRIYDLTHPEAPLTEWGRRFGMFVRERAAGRPVAYWLEATEFMGLQFYVNRYVLIPRSDTETLVEAAISALEHAEEPRILDVGTGSGCIGVSLAVFRPDAEVWALDISAQALRVARKNAAWLHVRDRFHWLRADFLQMDPRRPIVDAAGNRAGVFDAVLSNPPYIGVAERDTLAPEVLREPEEALFCGQDGFDMIDALLAKSAALLKPHGLLMVEIGYGQGAEAARRAVAAGWQEVALIADLAGIPRVLTARASG
ncbi:MAG TPA: peptide chain release factor N(5)-glutamine methyltransferase [Armatimonadota bacterium]